MTTTLDLIEAVSDKGGAVNEDVYGYSGNAAWVLDGATGLADRQLLSPVSDGRAYVDVLSASLHTLFATQTGPLSEVVEMAIRKVSDKFLPTLKKREAKTYEMPSAAMAMVRIRDGLLELAVLGDCRVLVQMGADVVWLPHYSPLEALDRRLIEQISALHRQGIVNPDEVRKRMLDRFRAQRSTMNTPEGYWALSFSLEAAAHLQTETVKSSRARHVLLVSDGFYRLVDTLHRFDPPGLLAAAVEGGLEPLVRRLRELERTDPDCVAWPRLKPQDDASAVLLSIGI